MYTDIRKSRNIWCKCWVGWLQEGRTATNIHRSQAQKNMDRDFALHLRPVVLRHETYHARAHRLMQSKKPRPAIEKIDFTYCHKALGN
jgi:hypothetical protein